MSAASTAAWLPLCPSLSVDIRWQLRHIRGECWWMVQNLASGEQVRLDERGAALARCLDGRTPLQDLISPDANPSPPDDDLAFLGELLAVLLRAGLIQTGGEQESGRLLHQALGVERAARRRRWWSPLSLRLPLWNPDRWLARRLPGVAWLYSWPAVLASLVLLMLAGWVALSQFQELRQALSNVVSSPGHWWHLALVYPFMKAVHELAHGFTLKRYGGAVHEMGVSLLVFMPVPHVDASEAWWLPQRRQRMLVSAIGVFSELLLAAMALLLWSVLAPGLGRDLALACVLTGLGSTLLFNANPLLRFDGYFVLQDALDIPNLGQRSHAYWRYLGRRWLCGVSQAGSPVSAPGERGWFVAYGALSSAYRWVVMIGISLFLLKHLAMLGVLLVLMSLWQLALAPLMRLLGYLRHAGELHACRYRAVGVSLGLLVGLFSMLALIPWASSTRMTGVVWVPAQAELFAAESGLLQELLVKPGQWVEPGQPVARLVAPELQGQWSVLEARAGELQTRVQQARTTDPGKVAALMIELDALQAESDEMARRLASLQLVAASGGRFAPVDGNLVPGRWLERGAPLGYLVDERHRVVRAVLGQARSGRVAAGIDAGSVWFPGGSGQRWPVLDVRQIPAADRTLPSPLLAYDGQSGIAVATHDEQLQTLEPVFHIELALPDGVSLKGIGGRAQVTLHHQPESLSSRLWRQSRQMFLRNMTT